MKKAVIILAILCGLTGCSKKAPSATDTGQPAPSSSAQYEINFETNPLQFIQAPLFDKDHTEIKTIDCDGLLFTIYQLPDDSYYFYLYVTVAGINYDLGVIGSGGPDIDSCHSIFAPLIQKISISATDTIYEVIRGENFDVITTTYFSIDNDIPILLYSIPGIGEQYDIDQDGQVETIANGGLSTSPNYLLYEWALDAGEIHIADLRTQLSCDTVVFDDAALSFDAGKRIDAEWYHDYYKYVGGYLEEMV